MSRTVSLSIYQVYAPNQCASIYVFKFFGFYFQESSNIPGSKPRHEVLNMANHAGFGSHPGFSTYTPQQIPPPPLKKTKKNKRGLLEFTFSIHGLKGSRLFNKTTVFSFSQSFS